MIVEMEALEKNITSEKCALSHGKKVVGYRWVFTVKHRVDGFIERYKTRLVAKCYTQTYGINYSKMFSPISKIDIIRVLVSIVVNRDWSLQHFDIRNAFLHGDLGRCLYGTTSGFMSSFWDSYVCRLKNALCSLKQSPRVWFGMFTVAMKKNE